MASCCNHPCVRGALTDFSGSLSDVLLFDLYRQIYMTRQTGTLEISDGEMVKRISFRTGSVTFATTNRDSERLGNLLLSEGRITREQLEAVLAETRPGKRFGQVLVARGLMGREDLDKYLRRHQSEIVISVLNLTRGSFRFDEALPAEYEDAFIDLSTADIILEGARRTHDPALFHRLLGDPDRPWHLAADALSRFQTISLNAQEGYLLSRFERPMSIAAVCSISALGETATLQALLGFVLAGILDFGEGPETDPAAGKERLPQALGHSVSPDIQKADPAPDICAMKAILDAATHYEVLGVTPESSMDQIRQAYFRLASRHHPDKWSKTVPPEVAEMAERAFQSMETAYKILTASVQRAQYDRELSPSMGPQPPKARDFEEKGRAYTRDVARHAFAHGVELFDCRLYVAALRQFKEAVRLEDAVAQYRYYLARTLARLPGRSREADFHFRIAVHQAPWNADIKKAYESFRQDPAYHRHVETLFTKALADLDR